ncbi:complement factor H-related protein 1-like [Rhineura floridana]|uniref:complement factor H-related protein 1-like n=1 Tax=Rhineura floridana TaxID=261503 RepID=UPI002AC8219E|nr:complement factor H-related protein 1-like [Rhineura floridana]
MSWLGYIVLLLLWRCYIFQNVPVQQEQVLYEHLVNPMIDSVMPLRCGRPPAVDNALLLASPRQRFSSGSTIMYQCYRLYVMEGTPLATCINGQWTGVPRCLKTCRANESDMERNNIQLRSITKSTSMRASDYWMEFECKPGFRKDPLSPPFRKQCVVGPWVYPRCI